MDTNPSDWTEENEFDQAEAKAERDAINAENEAEIAAINAAEQAELDAEVRAQQIIREDLIHYHRLVLDRLNDEIRDFACDRSDAWNFVIDQNIRWNRAEIARLLAGYCIPQIKR